MKKLSYDDYCKYFAGKCKICQGTKQILHEGVKTACVCQLSATLKFRFEQFEVDPPELKYKSWTDFQGCTSEGKILTDASLIEGKKKALRYCFDSDEADVFKDRKKHLIVHRHVDDGQNLIIVGARGSGRTLLAALIVKEIAHACHFHNKDISYKYIKSWDLQNAATWDNIKGSNHELLDELSDVNFLVIDQVELLPPGGHHTTPPDIIKMDSLFGSRRYKPTIIICSPFFWHKTSDENLISSIEAQWGRSFISLLADSNNVVIELRKESGFGTR